MLVVFLVPLHRVLLPQLAFFALAFFALDLSTLLDANAAFVGTAVRSDADAVAATIDEWTTSVHASKQCQVLSVQHVDEGVETAEFRAGRNRTFQEADWDLYATEILYDVAAADGCCCC